MRDYRDSLVDAMSERVPLPTSAATVEVLACKRALVFAKELSIFECSFEGDAEVIIKAILARAQRIWSMAMLLMMFL